LGSALSLRSVSGQGSTFSIDLPEVPSENIPTRIENVKPEAQNIEGRKALVVVIDDDRLVLRATQLVLEQVGYQVIAADTGAAATALLSEVSCAPVAIVCDYRLSHGVSGPDVIAAIREEFNTLIPAMIITGDTSPELHTAIADSGLPVLIKPVQAERLCSALAALISATGLQTNGVN
jgi:CheY-like chemotaxis protein